MKIREPMKVIISPSIPVFKFEELLIDGMRKREAARHNPDDGDVEYTFGS